MVLLVGTCQHGKTGIDCIECCRLAYVADQDELRRLNLQKEEARKILESLLDGCFCNGVNGELPDCDRCVGLRKALAALPEKQKCPSTHQQGKFTCEKDEGHLYRLGDVPHQGGGQTWLSI